MSYPHRLLGKDQPRKERYEAPQHNFSVTRVECRHFPASHIPKAVTMGPGCKACARPSAPGLSLRSLSSSLPASALQSCHGWELARNSRSEFVDTEVVYEEVSISGKERLAPGMEQSWPSLTVAQRRGGAAALQQRSTKGLGAVF